MNKSFSLLFIGNSFSDDTIEYMYDIAKEYGYDVIIESLYIGGCPLSTHLDNMLHDTCRYELRIYQDGKWGSIPNITIQETLKKRSWDYISFQQASPLSGKKESYKELDDLYREVLKYITNKKTKFIWNMTWAYQKGYPGLSNYGASQEKMFLGIIEAVKENILPRKQFIKIIPTGVAIQNARSSSLGDSWNRDGLHLDLFKGRFLASLCAFKTITDIDINDIKFTPNNVSELEKKVIIECINNAFNYPYQLTESTL